jgi:hypothetical protein
MREEETTPRAIWRSRKRPRIGPPTRVLWQQQQTKFPTSSNRSVDFVLPPDHDDDNCAIRTDPQVPSTDDNCAADPDGSTRSTYNKNCSVLVFVTVQNEDDF